MRILLLEDEDSIRGALARAFERDGHEVRAAGSVAEGRLLLAAWAPQVAVSDLKLPDGDGLELVGSLGVPLVMLSGYATYDDAVRALRAGAVDFFTKPVAIKDIRAAIARAVAARRDPVEGPEPAWTDRSGAYVALEPVLRRLGGRTARLAVAELAQMSDAGRIQVRADDAGVRIWLDAVIDLPLQGDRRAWLEAHGVQVVMGACGVLAQILPEPASRWDAKLELLWHEELIYGRVIQAGAWTMLGSWFLAALRAGLGPLSGLDPRLHAACLACGVAVPSAPGELAQPGVGEGERADLLADPELGAPLA